MISFFRVLLLATLLTLTFNPARGQRRTLGERCRSGYCVIRTHACMDTGWYCSNPSEKCCQFPGWSRVTRRG
uniref:ACP158 n=1 Tax=Drosophila yakuba TaxID=7245 RepID=Q20DJ4_DROYA|nr:ACP158 [Drosophila yakuba]ABD67478.1 ACP158 [Drosophila yakuba]ABD67480.1 ACP158 [Drosophila yakuba]ABD67481.1 ACP158 [Drosophila yakuba]ABD67482.1 ACP158 [Drosophila yakuba]